MGFWKKNYKIQRRSKKLVPLKIEKTSNSVLSPNARQTNWDWDEAKKNMNNTQVKNITTPLISQDGDFLSITKSKQCVCCKIEPGHSGWQHKLCICWGIMQMSIIQLKLMKNKTFVLLI